MNIDGLSEATLEKFVARGYIRELADLFRLKQYRNEITTMEGFGQKSFENLMNALQRAKKTTPARLLYSRIRRFFRGGKEPSDCPGSAAAA